MIAPINPSTAWQVFGYSVGIYLEADVAMGSLAETASRQLSDLIAGTRISSALAGLWTTRRDELTRAQSNGQPTKMLFETLAKDARATGLLMQGRSSVAWNPRDYQFRHLSDLIERISEGEDRALLRAPAQTGKTFGLAHFIEAIRTFYPGKRTLIVVPTRDIHSKILSELGALSPHFRIARLDASVKDRDTSRADIVLASAYTLGKPEHLGRIKPDEFGLVVIDEGTYALAPTWQKILKRLGFLDTEGGLQRQEGKFLLGLTADPFSLSSVFGDGAVIFSPPITWFEDNRYLHKLKGLLIEYPPEIDFETVSMEDESLLTPRQTSLQSMAIAQAYQQHALGKRTILFTTTIEKAKSHEAALNKILGRGFAIAVTSDMPQKDVDRVVSKFNGKKGPTVLILVKKNTEGVTLRGVEVMMRDYLTTSFRRFGQESGRPRAIAEGEMQRTITLIEMIPSGSKLKGNFVTLPRYLGLTDRIPAGIEYKASPPLDIKRGSGGVRPRRYLPYQHIHGLKFRFVSEEVSGKHPRTRLGKKFASVLAENFGGDFYQMAGALGLDMNTLDRYLYGAIPSLPQEVIRLANAMNQKEKDWLKMWEEDALEAIEFVHPIPKETPDFLKMLILKVRLASLYLGGFGSIISTLKAVHLAEDPSAYNYWTLFYLGRPQQWYKGHKPITHKSDAVFEKIFAILTHPTLIRAGITKEGEINTLIQLAKEELEEEGYARKFVPVGLAGDVWLAGLKEATGIQVEKAIDRDDWLREAERAVCPRAMMRIYGAKEVADDRPTAGITATGLLRSKEMKALETLSPRRREVIQRRFWGEETLEEVGDALETSRVNVSRIELMALRMLRIPSARRKWDAFFDSDISWERKFSAEVIPMEKISRPVSPDWRKEWGAQLQASDDPNEFAELLFQSKEKFACYLFHRLKREYRFSKERLRELLWPELPEETVPRGIAGLRKIFPGEDAVNISALIDNLHSYELFLMDAFDWVKEKKGEGWRAILEKINRYVQELRRLQLAIEKQSPRT